MFSALGFTKEAAYENFGFYLMHLNTRPPHGLAYGFDRMIMLMTKEDSIRCNSFPKVRMLAQ